MAHVGANGRLLTVTVAGRKWTLLVRRRDGTGDAALARFHGRDLSAFGLKPVVPNWPHFAWTHRLPTEAGMPCESIAEEPPYVISLIYPHGRSTRPHDVIEEFTAAFA